MKICVAMSMVMRFLSLLSTFKSTGRTVVSLYYGRSREVMQYVLEYISALKGTVAPYPTAATGAKISTLTRSYSSSTKRPKCRQQPSQPLPYRTIYCRKRLLSTSTPMAAAPTHPKAHHRLPYWYMPPHGRRASLKRF
jgi:hypothetical protein